MGLDMYLKGEKFVMNTSTIPLPEPKPRAVGYDETTPVATDWT
jgi:hypothetical protein